MLGIFAKLSRTPFLCWAAGWERGKIKGIPALLRKTYIRLTSQLVDRYLCYGSNTVDFLEKYGVDRSTCTILQNTVDTDVIANNLKTYKNNCFIKKKDLQIADKRVILSVGSLIERKNFALLLNAYNSLKNRTGDICLLIIGDGPERNNLIKLVDQNRIGDVFLLGQIVNEVGVYFMLADLFVLPGAGGLAINEAMAYGLPVICSEADGTEKDLVIDGQTGFLFRNGDVSDLASKIELALASQEDLRAMGRAAHDHIYTNASMPLMVERFVKVLFGSAK
jgi:glycosyltransferase involved in cell wall biosynthesis